MTNTTHTIDGQMGTLRYIADSPPEAHGGFAEQTVAAARWALAEIERLTAENEKLRTAWNVLEHPISRHELMAAVNNECTCGGGSPEDKQTCPACMVYHRLVTLRAIVKKGTE